MPNSPAPRPGPARTTTARWGRPLLALVVLGSLVVLFSPGALVPGSPSGTDKLVHGALFAALGAAALLAGARLRTAAASLVAYAALSEVLQALLPIRRDGNVPDALTDLAGLAVGLTVTWLVLRTRR